MNHSNQSKKSQSDTKSNLIATTPKARLYQIDTGWTLQVALPGVRQDQLKIEAEGSILRLHAESDQRRFERSFKLPYHQHFNDIEAALDAGLLTLKLTSNTPTKRQIEVKSI